ncbi:hypothetical protein BKA82DRAFT_437288 [Pisolithus tinctorius]|uniref:Uncharacterized protein n=1 Tax=Pisolithus tinctorius Marx 270 TaxID=870435 RepID=A0A0C3P0J5_PISTI|nr:hypothetical protein BKA82DRAFT_437288 [Pisolithus tinctorius]KIO06620.1 hypothetical protein M404DRAFT_437288 [Pisolithus tinctorius Marx 270]
MVRERDGCEIATTQWCWDQIWATSRVIFLVSLPRHGSKRRQLPTFARQIDWSHANSSARTHVFGLLNRSLYLQYFPEHVACSMHVASSLFSVTAIVIVNPM